MSTNVLTVYAKFRCAAQRIKKALGIFRELITTTTTTTTTKTYLHDMDKWPLQVRQTDFGAVYKYSDFLK